MTEDAILQAQATIDAAWIGGGLTLLAALIAAGGAIYGGVKAYQSAVRQIALAENQHKAKVRAYRFHIKSIMRSIEVVADAELESCDVALQEETERGYTTDLEIPNELTPSEWENHALLGVDIIERIEQVYAALRDVELFFQPPIGDVDAEREVWLRLQSAARLAQGAIAVHESLD
ncbi:hypothetical protein [Dongia sp.]|uniref:hypothetical protein n=1 Tax=Dongia sp. TaxID=1977262 RepID=UPI0035B0767C